jgi:hypothetical protein
MINYIRNLFCKHDWKFVKDTELYLRGHTLPVVSTRTKECTKCGKIWIQKLT